MLMGFAYAECSTELSLAEIPRVPVTRCRGLFQTPIPAWLPIRHAHAKQPTASCSANDMRYRAAKS